MLCLQSAALQLVATQSWSFRLCLGYTYSCKVEVTLLTALQSLNDTRGIISHNPSVLLNIIPEMKKKKARLTSAECFQQFNTTLVKMSVSIPTWYSLTTKFSLHGYSIELHVLSSHVKLSDI